MTRHDRDAAQAYKTRNDDIASLRGFGWTYREIGKYMDMTESAVSMAYSRHKKALEGSGVVAVSGRIPEAEHAEFQAMTERAKPLIRNLRGES